MLENLFEKGLIYDIELYSNCLIVSFMSLRKKNNQYKTFVIHGCRDERVDLFKLIKDRILIGYYSWNYDDAVLNHFIKNPKISVKRLWEFSQELINGDLFNPYRYKSSFESYDLLEVLRAGFNVISLKNAGINLKYATIQDLPIDPEQEITDKDLPELIKYNINDLNITRAIFDFLIPQLEMREILSDKHGLKLNSLSNSGLAKELIYKKYVQLAKAQNKEFEVKKKRTVRETISFKDVIIPDIFFNSVVLSTYLDELRQIHLTKPETFVNEDLDE